MRRTRVYCRMRVIMRNSVSFAAIVVAVFSSLSSNHEAVAAHVAVYDDPAFVDTTSGGFAAESDNLQSTLADLGHVVSTFAGTDGASFAAALAAADVVVIPELENGDLLAALDSLARSVVADFVAEGGGLLIASTTDARATEFLNALFGSALTFGVVGAADLTAAAVATAYEGGPDVLADNDRTRGLDVETLPAGAITPYVEGTRAPLARWGHGAGRVIYLGWDWYNALPSGAQDGGWFDVLGRSIIDATACASPGPDGDADGIVDICDSDAGCADVDGARTLGEGTRVVLKQLQGDGVANALAMTADLVLPPGSDFSLLDPRLVPVRVVIRAMDGSVRVVEQLPLAGYDRVGRIGWKFKPRAKKWVFKDRSGLVTNGLRAIALKDFRSRVERRVRVIVAAKHGSFPVAPDELPIGLLIVVGETALGECAETAFPTSDCAPSVSGARIKCRLR